VLLGAVIAADLPILLSGVARRGGRPGWPMQLGIEALRLLAQARKGPARGMGVQEMAKRLRADVLQLAPVIEALVSLDWVAPLAEEPASGDPRYVLLVDPSVTPLAPMVEALLPRKPVLEPMWERAPLARLTLADALASERSPGSAEGIPLAGGVGT
jgi:membrane protein